MRILIVCDDPTLLHYLERLLRHWNHRVLALLSTSLESAAEVSANVRMLDFDLALVRTVMPGLDGPALAAEMQLVSPRTRLVFLGELYDQESGERLDQTPAVESLPLPFETEALSRMLEADPK